MKYAVDRIIENIVVLEDIESGEIIEVNKKALPNEVHEGSILVKEDNLFSMDLAEEVSRRKNLRERLERLKNLKK